MVKFKLRRVGRVFEAHRSASVGLEDLTHPTNYGVTRIVC
jgi:hypothetical protein